MAQSSEYPDLPMVVPRSWTAGRKPGCPKLIVIHYTAGHEGPDDAEGGAAYDQRRTDGTSTHYYVDSNSVIQCVYTWDEAHTARNHGNDLGVQYELCGTVQTRAQWLDPVSDATLWLAARQAARDAKRYGIPVRRLSVAEVRAAHPDFGNQPTKGFCGHIDCTLAFPEDHGTHTDPGPEFPWDLFLARVQQHLDPQQTEVSEMGFLAVDANGTYYNCQAGQSFRIPADALPHIIYLAQQGAIPLARGTAPEWTNDGWVRKGWSETVFGVLPKAGLTDQDRQQLAAIADGIATLAQTVPYTAEDRAAMRDLLDAVTALNNRLTSP